MTTIVPNSAVDWVQQSPNFSPGRPYGDPDKIVIHHWGVDGQSHDGVANYLCNPNNHGASAHYVVSKKGVTQLVSERDRAWHAGPNGNSRGIGIECRPEMESGDIDQLKILISAIYEEHGPLPIYGHRDFMSTACPGRYYSILNTLPPGSTPTPKKPKVLSHAAQTGYGYITVDGEEDQETWSRFRRVMGHWYPSPWSDAVKQLQFFLSDEISSGQQKDLIGGILEKDGVEGPKTIKLLQWWMWHRGPNATWNPSTKVWQTWCPGWDLWDFVDGVKGPATIAVFQETLNYSVAESRKLGTWKP